MSYFDSIPNELMRLQHKFASPSRLMRQRFGVPAYAVLNTRWTQFVNHANYKIIDSNVMNCAKVTKVPTPPSAKRYFPPLTSMRCIKTISLPGMASYQKSLMTSHSVMEMCSYGVSCLRCELPNCNKCSVFQENETLFSKMYVMQVFSFYFSHFTSNCQRKARRAQYFGISLWSFGSRSNY